MDAGDEVVVKAKKVRHNIRIFFWITSLAASVHTVYWLAQVQVQIQVQLQDVPIAKSIEIPPATAATPIKTKDGQQQESRCALCFFGLPRAYKRLVLPSIEKNLLIPNAQHNCDVYVHYFYKNKEALGRMNPGGTIDPTEILLLAQKRRIRYVQFQNDTDEQFFEQRKDDLDRYRNTKDERGKLVYYPWKAHSWTMKSLENMVKQWHSIEAVFRLMENHAAKLGITYDRVGMFRNDVMYLTPIDIYNNDNITGINNTHTVVPSFAAYPVNDRMIYGPYDAVEIWSTKRFELIEKRAKLKAPGYLGWTMHSESFLASTIFPAIEELGYKIHKDSGICFLRTRADQSVMCEPCLPLPKTRRLVEESLGTSCVVYRLGKKQLLGCGENVSYPG